MDAEKKAQVVEAIGALHADQPEGEKKKPTVEDVQGVVGFDLTADDRDEAWDEYQDAKGDDSGDETEVTEPEVKKPKAPKRSQGRKQSTMVTNRHTGPIAIRGITIPVGQSRELPGQVKENGVIKRWIEAGVIEVG